MAKNSSKKLKHSRKAASSAVTPPAGLGTLSRRDSIAMLFTALFLMVLTIRIPKEAANTDLDPSWSSVLNYAHLRGLQFGTECVFTYGPMGFLTTPRFTGFEGISRLVWDASLYSLICIGVCLIAWRLKFAWRCLMLGMFVLLPAVCHSGPDLPRELCWGAATVVADKLYLIGGANPESFSNRTFMLREKQ